MTTPPAVVFLPLGAYQAAGLTQSLAALGRGADPARVDHAAWVWGATPNEARTIYRNLKGPRHDHAA